MQAHWYLLFFCNLEVKSLVSTRAFVSLSISSDESVLLPNLQIHPSHIIVIMHHIWIMAAIATSGAIGAAALQALARTATLQPKPASTDDRPIRSTRKRNCASTGGQSVEPPELKENAGAKLKFIEFVFHINDAIAKDIAKGIVNRPIQQKVYKRLIILGRWPPSSGRKAWSLRNGKERAYSNRMVWRSATQWNYLPTNSHLHNKAKEVLIFTDDCNTPRRIHGRLAYYPDGDMAHQIEAITQHSKTPGHCVIWLHLSPANYGALGNVAADKLARKSQKKFELEQLATVPPPV
ncbi:hypothetical protein N7530_007270 [Penicillium desertorum]|uniref:RNase H type-1 domain-containing protein n=1 Tax=Penicillium desertorum TaxID=1303715 RepID=A0A9X0BK14_9EURO|nr:hypothetical protein N7530_007270 [Penicillium desertorum]